MSEYDSSGDSDDNSSEQFETDQLASSTQKITVDASSDVKLKLIDEIKRTSALTNSRYKKALKGIHWEKIDIPGRSQAELEEILDDIIKKAGVMRTLGEILDFYEKNQMSAEKKADENKPKKPRLAFQLYFDENQEKIKEKYMRESGEKYNYLLAMKFAKEKYDAMSDKKKQPYIDKHAKNFLAYKKAMAEYKASNPEYFKRKKAVVKKKAPKADAKPAEPQVLTPFSLYRSEAGAQHTYFRACHLWKELPDSEKIDYIKRVVQADTEYKKISVQEKKILDLDGMPKRPQQPYILFGNDFRESYNGEKKDLTKSTGEAWKNISDKKKKYYETKYEEALVEYGLQLEQYIANLPKDQQMMMKMTYKKYLPKTALMSKTATFRGTDDETDSPKKKKIKLETAEKSAIVISEVKSLEKPKSPKKAEKVVIPPYPSDTTAHHFMMQVHDGDAKKARKAYKKLSAHEKKAYNKEMCKAKQEYLTTSSTLFKKLTPAQVKEEKAKIQAAKDEQKEQIDWHKPSGTDNDENSDSSSDDDSDSD